MKKLSTLLIALIFAAVSFAAPGEGPGNPEKAKPQDSLCFNLSRGYFSLFNLLSFKTTSSDTVRIDQFLRERKVDPLLRPR